MFCPSICGRGFGLTGSGSVLNTNRAEKNADREFVIGPNNIDGPQQAPTAPRILVPGSRWHFPNSATRTSRQVATGGIPTLTKLLCLATTRVRLTVYAFPAAPNSLSPAFGVAARGLMSPVLLISSANDACRLAATDHLSVILNAGLLFGAGFGFLFHLMAARGLGPVGWGLHGLPNLCHVSGRW